LAYTAISDFKYGMDRRRPQDSGVPGTLWLLKNAVITRGGDIERAKKFVEVFALPTGTFGLFSVRRQRYVFGSGSTPAGMPVGVRYQQLASPSAADMTAMLDARGFDGKVYAVASYADGNVHHFYDGVRVTAWDGIADSAATFTSVAARLADLIDAESAYSAQAFGDTVEITAAVPGTTFTAVPSATDNGATTNPTAVGTEVQANVAAVAEVRATGSVEITGGTAGAGANRVTSVTVDSAELLATAVNWVGSHASTANALAVEINNNTVTHGFSASAASGVVTITAAIGTGATPNTDVVASTVSGDVTTSDTDMSGGVDAVAAVARIYTVDIGADEKAAGTVTVTGGTSSAGVNKTSSITIAGEELLSASVDWTTSHDDTATAIAADISSGAGTHGFTAAAIGAVVTITSADGEGRTLDETVITVTNAGDVTTTETDMAFINHADDLWKITLDGDAYQTTGRGSATGTSANVGGNRVFAVAGTLLRYCKINDPLDWTDTSPSSGAGFINIANQAEGADTLVGAAKYEQLTAIFARNAIVTYDLQADMTLSAIAQTLDNTGTSAPRSIVSYGANDVYYLDETGVRSLRTRSAIDSAYASDVGSALDPFVQGLIAEVGAGVAAKACAVIEAIDGRFMLALGRYIVVLSQFPSSNIVAWSYIDFGAEISDLVRVDRAIYLRSGDKIYAYGGVDGTVYPDADEFTVEAVTPFISAKDPAGTKMIEGLDIAATNTWKVRVLPDPNYPEQFIDGGTINGTNYHLPANKLTGKTSHYALQLTCSAAGYARLSSTAVHHATTWKD